MKSTGICSRPTRSIVASQWPQWLPLVVHGDKGMPQPQPLSNSKAAYVPPSYGGPFFGSLLPPRPMLHFKKFGRGTVALALTSVVECADWVPYRAAFRLIWGHSNFQNVGVKLLAVAQLEWRERDNKSPLMPQ
jgi:hypothetical protein